MWFPDRIRTAGYCARLLVKAGYTVRIGKEKPANKPNGAYVFYIEFTAPGQKEIDYE